MECKLCNKEKDSSEFYVHKNMKSGYINQCKECIKKRNRIRYNKLSLDENWMIREKERSKDKYYRLYRGNIKNDNRLYHNDNSYKGLRSWLKRIINIDDNQQIHHWNYNLIKSFFILDIKFHKKIHRDLIYDFESLCFYYNGDLLDTKEKHLNYLIDKSVELNYDYQIILYEY